MTNRVHTPAMAKTDIMIRWEDGCSLGVFVGGPRACGLAWELGDGVWRAWWVFWAWHGASGVDDSGITRYSFAGAGVCPVGSWLSLRDLLCSFVHWCPFLFAGLHAWGLLMQTWAAIFLLLDSNWELNNHK